MLNMKTNGSDDRPTVVISNIQPYASEENSRRHKNFAELERQIVRCVVVCSKRFLRWRREVTIVTASARALNFPGACFGVPSSVVLAALQFHRSRKKFTNFYVKLVNL